MLSKKHIILLKTDRVIAKTSPKNDTAKSATNPDLNQTGLAPSTKLTF